MTTTPQAAQGLHAEYLDQMQTGQMQLCPGHWGEETARGPWQPQYGSGTSCLPDCGSTAAGGDRWVGKFARCKS